MITKDKILDLAKTFAAYPDCPITIRGDEDVLAFARAVLEQNAAPAALAVARDEQVDSYAGMPIITNPLAIESTFAADDNT
jgi:hypothetical protein